MSEERLTDDVDSSYFAAERKKNHVTKNSSFTFFYIENVCREKSGKVESVNE